MNSVDYVDLLNKPRELATFDRRFRVSELEYNAFKSGTSCRTVELVDAIVALSKIYNTDEVQRMAKEAITDRPFISKNLSFNEFREEWKLYTYGYCGITKYIADYIEGKSGNYSRDEQQSYEVIYSEYITGGPFRIQELLQHCRDEGYEMQFWYENPNAWKAREFKIEPMTEVPVPPELPTMGV